MFQFLRQYYEFFLAFNKVDTGKDQKVSKEEFLAAAPAMKQWGIDMSNPDKQWKSADKDGKGQVLFGEFVNWAFNGSLDMDDNDDDVNEREQMIQDEQLYVNNKSGRVSSQ